MYFTINANMLNACILAQLEDGASYGYALTQALQDTVECSESTLYPALRRLEKEGLLMSYNKEFNGRNRKFYELTKDGRIQLDMMRSEWTTYCKTVERLLKLK